MTSHPSLVLLNRHLAAKESSPFTLLVDTLAQSASYLIKEIVHRSTAPIIYLSFETTIKPDYATHYMDCSRKSVTEIQTFLNAVASSKPSVSSQKSLIIVDSLNYLPQDGHAAFISGIVQPNIAIIACYHNSVPVAHLTGYPLPLRLLSYIALAIFEVEPVNVSDVEDLDALLSRFHFPTNKGLNLPTFKLHLTSRRKSGKSLTHSFIIDTTSHKYDIFKPEKDESTQEDEELLKGLTTFNLTTNSKQKLAREQVELPFMEAQTELGKFGGAIVYEFEKDDDYDEEDPYEDPF